LGKTDTERGVSHGAKANRTLTKGRGMCRPKNPISLLILGGRNKGFHIRKPDPKDSTYDPEQACVIKGGKVEEKGFLNRKRKKA